MKTLALVLILLSLGAIPVANAKDGWQPCDGKPFHQTHPDCRAH